MSFTLPRTLFDLHGVVPAFARRASLVASLALPFALGAQRADAARPISIPVRFDAHRIYVTPLTTRGDTLNFILDSGFDDDFLSAALVDRLRIPVDTVVEANRRSFSVRLRDLKTSAAIPDLSAWAPNGGRFTVVPLSGDGLLIARASDAGVIGSPWLADRTWTFDYPAAQLLLWPKGYASPPDRAHRIPLGFRVGAQGRRTTQFARISFVVDGDSLDALFDTGATMNLTTEAQTALAAMGDNGPARRAGSFIGKAMFDRWRQRHPDWPVIERAEDPTSFPMIRVPLITVAGFIVGPVWFTLRPEGAFPEYMSKFMDRPVIAALGGSALQYFRVTLDYPAAVAYFERPQ